MNKQKFHSMVAQYGTKTVTGMDGVEWSGGAHCHIPSLKFYGRCYLTGTPAPDSPVDIYCNASTYVSTASGKYLYPPDLRGIGEYKDEWDYVSGKGLRYVHKVVLDGTTNKVSFANTKTARFMLPTPALKDGHEAIISTHFKSSWNTNHGSIYILDKNIVAMSMNGSLTVDEWNAWLTEQYVSGTPVTIYYVVADPIPFEGRHEWDVYEPISNESGAVLWGDGNISGIPVEVTYITHS